MHLRFSFFQPSSHFLRDTHFEQSLCLDEEGFLWLSFCSFVPWSYSLDLCRTLYTLNVISLCILCILHLFVCIVLFLFLILLYCFCFVWVKIQNHIKVKNWKSLIVYVWAHITCEFGLVPSYLWRSAFMSLTCYVCTSIFMGKILKSMCDCCKSIFELVMNDWSIVLLVLIHA